MNSLHKDDACVVRVHAAIAQIRQGKMVIMTDDIKRENEGDLIFAAEDVSAEKINFMARHARGLVCLSLAPEYIDQLQLPLMRAPGKETAGKETAFTMSIEARYGVSTGISAADRAHTIAVAIADSCTPDDIVVPGHIFPLRARSGGVLERPGHTEGSVDLAKLAGRKPAAVICEIMNDDGSMARLPDLEVFARTFALPIVSVEDLIAYRLFYENPR
jgi:3,4-dihydroxy 2-butanone 4-phosphate synthase/GTP cyclohydrolase II